MASVGEPPAPLHTDIKGGPFLCSSNHFDVHLSHVVFINLASIYQRNAIPGAGSELGSRKTKMNKTQSFHSQTPGDYTVWTGGGQGVCPNTTW